MASYPVLHKPNYDLPFIVQTDASYNGISGILSQIEDGEEHPVAYISRSLIPAEKNYAITELECLAVVWAIDKFRYYLYHKPFEVHTDQRALAWLASMMDSNNRRLARWAFKLQEMDFKILHRAGKLNGNADALSRLAVEVNSENTVNHGERVKKRHSEISQQIEQFSVKPKLYWSSALMENRLCQSCRKNLIAVITIQSDTTENTNVSNLNNEDGNDQLSIFVRNEAKFDQRRLANESDRGGDQTIYYDPADKDKILIDDPYKFLGISDAELLQDQQRDPKLKKIFDYFERGRSEQTENESAQQLASRLESNDFFIDSETGILFRKLIVSRPKRKKSIDRMKLKIESKSSGVVVIPEPLQARVARLFHNSLFGCHFGINKTISRVRQYCWWMQMDDYLREFVRSCTRCQLYKAKRSNTILPVGAMETPDYPFQRISIDIAGPIYPESKQGNRYILAVVDHFSRWVVLIPLKTFDAQETARALLVHVFTVYGFPEILLSDKGTNFISDLAKAFYRFSGIKKITTASKHPNANGMIERVIGTIKELNRVLTNSNQVAVENWELFLPFIMYAVNISEQDDFGISAYFILYGRVPRNPVGLPESEIEFAFPTTDAWINEQMRIKQIVNETVHEILARKRREWLAQNEKSTFNAFKVGDEVVLNQRIFNAAELRDSGIGPTFSRRWIGPFIVEGVISNQTYSIKPHRDLIERLILYDIPRIVNVRDIRKWNRRDRKMEIDFNKLPTETNKLIRPTINSEEELAQKLQKKIKKSIPNEKKKANKRSRAIQYEFNDILRHEWRTDNGVQSRFVLVDWVGYEPSWVDDVNIPSYLLEQYERDIETGVRDKNGKRLSD